MAPTAAVQALYLLDVRAQTSLTAEDRVRDQRRPGRCAVIAELHNVRRVHRWRQRNSRLRCRLGDTLLVAVVVERRFGVQAALVPP